VLRRIIETRKISVNATYRHRECNIAQKGGATMTAIAQHGRQQESPDQGTRPPLFMDDELLGSNSTAYGVASS